MSFAKHMSYCILFAAASGCSSALADQPVTFTASEQVFSVIPTATGTVHNDGVFLTVALDRFTLRLRDKSSAPEHVLGYRVCLVRSLGNGSWECARSSATVKVNYSIAPGQTESMPAYKAQIPIDGLGNIQGDWLAISVDVQGDGPAGVVYAHSQNWKGP